MSDDNSALTTYRELGPFDNDSLPKGLLVEHRLKPGSWGRLSILSGTIALVWDDTGERAKLSAGTTALVPPIRPHHLEADGPFCLTLEFQRGRGRGRGRRACLTLNRYW